MIFLTLGTQVPYDRLVKAMDLWSHANPSVEVFGQITDPGAGGYRPKNFEWVAWLTPAEYQERFLQSSLIVAHAGMGSIITALTSGKPIVIMPRRAHLGEQRNDHQFATARRFAGKPGIHVAETEAELPAALDRARAAAGTGGGTPISEFAEPELTRALRAFVHGEPLA